MKLGIAIAALLLLSGCAPKKHAQPPPPPAPPAEAKPKPKLRPIRSGDMVLHLPDGSIVVCHRPILVIDSHKRHEDVPVYQCR